MPGARAWHTAAPQNLRLCLGHRFTHPSVAGPPGQSPVIPLLIHPPPTRIATAFLRSHKADFWGLPPGESQHFLLAASLLQE